MQYRSHSTERKYKLGAYNLQTQGQVTAIQSGDLSL
jgi:hypothetical protein